MKYIAFLKVKNTILFNEIKSRLPAEYIIEHYDISEFPKDFFKAPIWEIENEDHFKNEFAKNEDIMKQFNLQLHELSIDEKRIYKEAAIKEYLRTKEDYTLYLQFLEWKKANEQHKYLHNIGGDY